MTLLRSFSAAMGLLIAGSLAFSVAHAQNQGNQRKRSNNGQYTGQSVATQPSNSPFSNPIMQPLPPAVSVNPALNSNRTNAPIFGSSPR